ncbi:hypothetical protein D3C71_1441180 [compost metagenome]
MQVFGFEETEQHDDHQQRHHKFNHADQVVGFGKGLDAVVVQREEKTQQQQLDQPADQRWIAGARLAQKRKPGGGVLTGGHDLNGYQAGERDQGNKAQQIAHQFTVGKHRIADNTAGARQRCAQLTIDNAEQQHRQAADQPGANTGRAGNGRDVAGGEQPAGTKDCAQADKRQIGERKLLLEFALGCHGMTLLLLGGRQMRFG